MKSSSSRHGQPAELAGSRFAALLSIAATVMVAGLLVAAPGAKAARVSVAGTTLTVAPTAADPPEQNVITIDRAGDLFTVRDTGAPLQTDGTCTVAGDTASCPAAGIDRLLVNLGPGDDELTIAAQTKAFVSGRDGADLIRVRNGVADPQIDCGAGVDPTAIVDPQDFVTNCEDSDNGIPPQATIDSGPPPVLNPGGAPVEFEFSASEPAVTFNCRLDAQVFSDCSSPFSTGLLDEGTHTFAVAATDRHGNTDPTEATSTFTVDMSPPNTSITAGPPDITDTRTPTFEFASTEDPASFVCQIDDGPIIECASPFTLPALENGDHKFHVWAQDAAGNLDQTGAARSFIVASSTLPPAKAAGQPPFVIVLGSVVLISGRTVKMSKQGVVPVSLNCAGSQVCKGKMVLATADPVRITARKIARLGAVKFRIAPKHRKLIKVRLGKRNRHLVKRLGRVRTRATIREVDLRGNPRVSSRTFTLRGK